MSTRDADHDAVQGRGELVGFLRAMSLADARKLLTGGGVVMVSHILASWNHLDAWLRQIEALRRVV